MIGTVNGGPSELIWHDVTGFKITGALSVVAPGAQAAEPVTGAIRFECDAAGAQAVHCFCTDCQKLTTTQMSTNLLMARSAFRLARSAVLDDHVPFLDAGIPAVDLIDFRYPEWHTVSDLPDRVSPESSAQSPPIPEYTATYCLPSGAVKVIGAADVGVAGLHRLMEHRPKLAAARVIICVAGMEGALPSVIV